MAEQWFATTGMGLPHHATMAPSYRLDTASDVLYLDFGAPNAPRSAEFDENELFVFRDMESGIVVGFAIHAFNSYWRHNIEELMRALTMYNSPKAQALLWQFIPRPGHTAGISQRRRAAG